MTVTANQVPHDAAAFPLPPGSTVGVLGGGQLGRMLALAAARLGLETVVLDPDGDCPAAAVAGRAIAAGFDDLSGLNALARAADVITFEFENVPAETVQRLIDFGAAVAPGPRALAVAQDRVEEKTFLNLAGAPTVAFAAASSKRTAVEAARKLGAPCLIKTRRDGYDGKGQSWIEHAADAADAFAKIGGVPAILEAPANFTRELSVIAARSRGGEIVLYPLAENHHENGILRRTTAPAEVSVAALEQAQQIAARILTALDYVGVLAVELFELGDGRLLVNEIAPRVHNSGHWTLDGCEVDQFEQHLRAVAGWPLGPTHALAQTEMLNLLGEEAEDWPRLIGDPTARLWLYGKREARAGRKMGHVNRLRPLED
jgi:5-(carboxyamino)imidazole ribonucleotide synthase